MIEVRAERVSSKNLIILITKLPLVIVDGNDNPIWKILHWICWWSNESPTKKKGAKKLKTLFPSSDTANYVTYEGRECCVIIFPDTHATLINLLSTSYLPDMTTYTKNINDYHYQRYGVTLKPNAPNFETNISWLDIYLVPTSKNI